MDEGALPVEVPGDEGDGITGVEMRQVLRRGRKKITRVISFLCFVDL